MPEAGFTATTCLCAFATWVVLCSEPGEPRHLVLSRLCPGFEAVSPHKNRNPHEHTPLQYGSVASGIEAASLAWQPLGWQAVWFAEIDPFANAVLAHHYPDVPNLGDMRQIAGRIRGGAAPAPDILVGGTPCQAFSVAGLHGGLDDPRGALTLTFTEIANAIDDTRQQQHPAPPSIIVWENVPGVLYDRANAFGTLLGALAGEGHALQPPGRKWTHAGYVSGARRRIAWRVLDAQ
jgi:DNA (cytosine-5)-methyltransferase 1